jgi:aspartate carbamoyltransferase regulatory subunit
MTIHSNYCPHIKKSVQTKDDGSDVKVCLRCPEPYCISENTKRGKASSNWGRNSDEATLLRFYKARVT